MYSHDRQADSTIFQFELSSYEFKFSLHNPFFIFISFPPLPGNIGVGQMSRAALSRRIDQFNILIQPLLCLEMKPTSIKLHS